jgi:hypothetical protein
MFSVVTPRIWVSPRSNSAEPWTRGMTPTRPRGADVGDTATVDTDLVTYHPLANELLGQSAEGTTDLFFAALELRADLLDCESLDPVKLGLTVLLRRDR